MGTETVIGLVFASVGALVSLLGLGLVIYFLVQFVQGKRTLDDIRDLIGRPPGSYRDN